MPIRRKLTKAFSFIILAGCLILTTSCAYGNNESKQSSEESEKMQIIYYNKTYEVEIKEDKGLVTDDMIIDIIRRHPYGDKITILEVAATLKNDKIKQPGFFLEI
jgi:hypothetical protein